MKIINSKLKGLKVIISNKFRDNRGYLREIYKKKNYQRKFSLSLFCQI